MQQTLLSQGHWLPPKNYIKIYLRKKIWNLTSLCKTYRNHTTSHHNSDPRNIRSYVSTSLSLTHLCLYHISPLPKLPHQSLDFLVCKALWEAVSLPHFLLGNLYLQLSVATIHCFLWFNFSYFCLLLFYHPWLLSTQPSCPFSMSTDNMWPSMFFFGPLICPISSFFIMLLFSVCSMWDFSYMQPDYLLFPE